MNVLKFGGSSVANATTIQQVLDIIKNIARDTPVFVVVSALGGVTDLLLKAGYQASINDDTYKGILAEIESRHMQTAKALIPVAKQSRIISKIKADMNRLESLCEGIYLLKELSPKTEAILSGLGELLSSYLIVEAALVQDLDIALHDSREYIFTTAAAKVTVDYHKVQDCVDSPGYK